MRLNKHSLEVLREAILRLEQSVGANKSFHGSRIEAVMCVVDAITHPGRDINATAIKRDTQQFFRLGALHLSSAIEIERRSNLQNDEMTRESIDRFKNGAKPRRIM
jgi:hypothetical protein